MYHNRSPHIIEASDITHLHSLHVVQVGTRKIVHLVGELPIDQDTAIPAGQEYLLHTTDGVHHSLLHQEHYFPRLVAPDAELPAPTGEEPPQGQVQAEAAARLIGAAHAPAQPVGEETHHSAKSQGAKGRTPHGR
jgi:hypothetical protein